MTKRIGIHLGTTGGASNAIGGRETLLRLAGYGCKPIATG